MGRKPKDKTLEPKGIGIFDWLKVIMTTKQPWSSFSELDKKSFEPYMVNRFLSMNQDYIEIVNLVQTIPYSDKEKYYRIYCEFIPKKYIFSKYIKSSKKEINKEILEKISQFYECSFGEAEEYFNLLGNEGVEGILEKTGVDEKTIKKLLK